MYKLPERRGRGGEVIRAMPERKHSFFGMCSLNGSTLDPPLLQLQEALGFPTPVSQAHNEWKQCACNETRFVAHSLFCHCQLANCAIISR